MSPISDEEYFYNLDNMVIRSTHYLRQIFKNRWKVESGEDWTDEHSHVQMFLNQHCGHILKKAIPLQKKILLESSSLDDWDISIMSLVLLNFGDRKKYEAQNQAIRRLKNLRNDLAHHKSKRLSQCEYSEKAKAFKESLLMLEIKSSDIKKLVKESSANSSFEDTARLKFLLKTAEQLMKLQDFESALNQYSEALNIPRLSSNILGEIYEKRAACYLNIKVGQNIDEKHSDQATLDVEQALKLNKSSWHAHYLKAQCHKAKNNLHEAIRYYEMALALSPIQGKVKQDLDSCRLKYSTQKSNANLNLDELPVSVSEIAEKNREDYGRIYTLAEVAELAGFENCPLYLGEKYYHGLEIAQDYAKAIKYFAQADKQGHAAGTYKLGNCYYRGHGVQQDVVKAVEIFKRCANMDAKKETPFQPSSPLGFNNGVASAENSIANCYEKGTGVGKNLVEAAKWYKRAMEHGNSAAATNLGLLYFNGHGLAKNEKMAMMCWKQGLNLGCTSAAESLVLYYSEQLEPEMAWIMFRISRELGNFQFLQMSDESFNRNLTMVQSERCRLEKRVITFEKEHGIDFKGMTFKERSNRTEQQLNPNYVELINPSTSSSWGGDIQNIGKDAMMTVGIRGFSGSKTALGVIKTLHVVFELNELLGVQNELSKTQKLKAVNLFYECMISEDHLKRFVKSVKRLQTIVEELFYETCEQIDEKDMKIRLCYVGYNLMECLNTSDELYAFGILKEGLRRYPDNYGYHRLFIVCLMGRKSYKSALQFVSETLEKFPNKVDLHFFKAHILLFSRHEEYSEINSIFKVFLDNAPRDHRHVPEAYYMISFVHMTNYICHDFANDPGYTNEEKIKMVQDNFKCGKEAENDQLPCYQPYGESHYQLLVHGFLCDVTEKRKLNSNLNDSSKTVAILHSKGVLERKDYMKSPVRKGLILQHRERHRDSVSLNQKSYPFDDKVIPETLQQNRVKKMAQLRSVTLQEFNPTKDRIYENTILDLTIIEEPNIYSNSIQIIAEDDNWDTTRVYLDAVPTEKVCLERFAVGSRIAIINPFMGICAETGVNGIRINEYKCIMYLEKAKDLCRFCGEKNASRKCSNCKRLYCSRECQKLDWQLFEHKLICSK